MTSTAAPPSGRSRTATSPPTGVMTGIAWLQLLTLSALWGSSYLFIEIALRDVGPLLLAGVRVGGAALALLPLLWRHRMAIAERVRGRWWRLPVIAAFQIAIPFPLISAGETHVDSGLAGTLVSTQPLWLVLLAPVLALPQPGVRGYLGTLLGLAGVATLLGLFGGLDRTPDPRGTAMIIAAAAAYAIGAALVRRWMSGVDPVAVTAVMTATATILLLPGAAFDLPNRFPGVAAVAALAVLALGCTAGAFVLYNRLIATVGPSNASLVSYLAPAFAVAYGAGILNEHLGVGTVVGLALILLGSWICTRSGRQGPPRRT